MKKHPLPGFFPAAAIATIALLTGCSEARTQEYFEQSVNKKERNYVLQQCREKEGKLSGKETAECQNAQQAYDTEQKKKTTAPG